MNVNGLEITDCGGKSAKARLTMNENKLFPVPKLLLPSEAQSLRDDLQGLRDSRDRHMKTLTLAIMDIQQVMHRLEAKLGQLREVRDDMIDEQIAEQE